MGEYNGELGCDIPGQRKRIQAAESKTRYSGRGGDVGTRAGVVSSPRERGGGQEQEDTGHTILLRGALCAVGA